MAAQVWHKAPFIRLLAPLMTGIAAQRQWPVALPYLLVAAAVFSLLVAGYSLASIRYKFRLASANGVVICLLLAVVGGLLVWQQDVRNHPLYAGRFIQPGSTFIVTLQEPLVEKPNSYKALAAFTYVGGPHTLQPAKGTLILYFKKDSVPPPLHYGTRLLINQNVQEVKNSGNPAGFDYKRYLLATGTTHQAFLSAPDYTVLPGRQTTAMQQGLFVIRTWVVQLLHRYIPGNKESGLAEALLIGYKDDLDKKLVEAYSNTGVVHIIAISGLHIGLIYWLLLGITKPLQRFKNLNWLRLFITIAALWLFTLLAGAQPSVLRSAVMFTAIAIGQLAVRRSNIYNTMALSAFVLLCINPFWLWDVGFQLSYLAVLSIILFFQPVYNWFYFKNKGMDFFWKLTAVTISAQLLTMPVSIYHFHQVPLLFLFTNFLAVPLSSGIVIAEIVLCAVAFIPPLAALVGALLHHAIYFMNTYVEGLDAVPFSVWSGLSISVWQMLLLLVFTVAFCYWLMERQRWVARTAAIVIGGFFVLQAASFTQAYRQQELIVYNVPRHTAIDVIAGRQYQFIGDSNLLYNDFARNFHLQPSRVAHRMTMVENNSTQVKSFAFGDKKILLVDETLAFTEAVNKPLIDVLIISKSPKVAIADLANAFAIKQVVLDGAVPPWKAAEWSRHCHLLHIPCYNVADSGAFVLYSP